MSKAFRSNRFVEGYITGLRLQLPTRYLKHLDAIDGATDAQLEEVQKCFPAVPCELLSLLAKNNGTAYTFGPVMAPLAPHPHPPPLPTPSAAATVAAEARGNGSGEEAGSAKRVSQAVRLRAGQAVHLLSTKLRRVTTGELGEKDPKAQPRLAIPVIGSGPFGFALRSVGELTEPSSPFLMEEDEPPATAVAATGPAATTLRWRGTPCMTGVPLDFCKTPVQSLFAGYATHQVKPEEWEEVDATLAKKMRSHHHHLTRPRRPSLLRRAVISSSPGSRPLPTAGSREPSPGGITPPIPPAAAGIDGSGCEAVMKKKRWSVSRATPLLLLADCRVDLSSDVLSWLIFAEGLHHFPSPLPPLLTSTPPPPTPSAAAAATPITPITTGLTRPSPTRLHFRVPKSRLFLDFSPKESQGGTRGQVVRLTWLEGEAQRPSCGAATDQPGESPQPDAYRTIVELRVLAPDFRTYLKQIVKDEYDFMEEIAVEEGNLQNARRRGSEEEDEEDDDEEEEEEGNGQKG